MGKCICTHEIPTDYMKASPGKILHVHVEMTSYTYEVHRNCRRIRIHKRAEIAFNAWTE